MNTARPDIEELASEYVLGTLSAQQRLEVQQRLLVDDTLRNAVDAWEQRLHPLTDQVAAVTPSPRLWTRIERSVSAMTTRTPAPKTVAPAWWDALALWRGLAAAGLAASVVFAALLFTREIPLNQPSYLVVLVAPQDKAPGWVVQASGQQDIQLIPLGMTEVPADMALQFWTKADSWQGPVSLGLVKPGQTLQVPLDSLPPLEADQLFELTLERSTGSPTGKPTGPIQFIGRAVKVI
ncbi:anti-sigma factor [Pseudomonas sp. PDM14]|uniref:anti-sigma factor n=1 Tax=Pseudomonas sp. PDM14 TaxID=2769288 RepID=UPI001781C153|nr:anti-sigma factor [Pseudomonas sp. PDM14]MBD9482567.1 anti-sigma factor [Pseudomonas sp. PDM14]